MSRQGIASLLAVLAGLAALPTPGGATENLLDSQSPYWEAGPRDPKLSNACSLGRFNERQMGRYVVRLHAKDGGAAVLGVAKGGGLNLWDPDRLAVVSEDYLFRQDGTSACEVFVGGRKAILPNGKPPAQPPKPAPAAPVPAPAPTPAPAPGTPPPAPQPAVPGASPTNGPPT